MDHAKELFATAAIALRLRKLIFENKFAELGKVFGHGNEAILPRLRERGSRLIGRARAATAASMRAAATEVLLVYCCNSGA